MARAGVRPSISVGQAEEDVSWRCAVRVGAHWTRATERAGQLGVTSLKCRVLAQRSGISCGGGSTCAEIGALAVRQRRAATQRQEVPNGTGGAQKSRAGRVRSRSSIVGHGRFMWNRKGTRGASRPLTCRLTCAHRPGKHLRGGYAPVMGERNEGITRTGGANGAAEPDTVNGERDRTV